MDNTKCPSCGHKKHTGKDCPGDEYTLMCPCTSSQSLCLCGHKRHTGRVCAVLIDDRACLSSDGYCRCTEPQGIVSTPLPMDAGQRKEIPLVSGLLDYFPAALAAVAHVSKVGNDQHNPGQPIHWARGKSDDHADAELRHLMERGTIDTDGLRHSAKRAWRALADLQEELERDEGAPLPRAARRIS